MNSRLLLFFPQALCATRLGGVSVIGIIASPRKTAKTSPRT